MAMISLVGSLAEDGKTSASDPLLKIITGPSALPGAREKGKVEKGVSIM